VLVSAIKTSFVVSDDTRLILKRWMTAPDSVFVPAMNEMCTFPAFVGARELAVPPFEDPLVQPFCVDARSPDFWLVDMKTGELFECRLDQAWGFDEMVEAKPIFTRIDDTFQLTGVKAKDAHKGGCCGMPRPGGVAKNQMIHPIQGYVMCVLCMGRLRPGQFNTCDQCSQ